jgi:hypothetical protein
MNIIYPQENNKLAITILTGSLSLEEAIKKDIPSSEYAIVSKLNIDNVFFDAYEYQNKQAVVNIDKTKEIWLNYYRTARTPLLEKLDLEYMRADEAEDLELKKEIASKKQALRDVTKTELPNTLEGIKNTWPEILGQNPFA